MRQARLLLMIMGAALLLASGAVLAVPVLAVTGADDTAVTDQPYVRHDGGSDRAIRKCSSDAPRTGRGNFQQNEPALAVSPSNPNLMVAGANDYCISALPSRLAWEGVYVSRDGGESWTDSLLPGYPGDTSSEGMASPLFGVNENASDPILDWDNDGHLFAGGIAFNFSGAANANAFVATFGRDRSSPLGINYLRTRITGEGTPTPLGTGHFSDKPSLKVDDWKGSPHEGNVYTAWTLFPGVGQGGILFSRSTDAGKTFSNPIKIANEPSYEQGSDIAVAPDGTIYVVWRRFASASRPYDAIAFAKSTDGGQTFSEPRNIRRISPYDRFDQRVGPGPPPEPDPGGCGDGVALCASHFVFHRTTTFPQATVDKDGDLYVSWEQVSPVPDNGDTYHPDGQSRVVVTKSTNGGGSFRAPVRVAPRAVGHQWWPNIEYDKAADALVLIYYDSRTDPSYSPYRPPGNRPNATSVCGTPVGSRVCNVLNTYIATSNEGLSWSSRKVSSVGHQPEYELHLDRQVPFHGDYIWVDAVGGEVYGVWTDNRDVVPGRDPRERRQDGFDVLQCRADPTSPDTCPNAGGQNQNIYGGGFSLP